MEILVLSSLEKVFSDEKPNAKDFSSLSMLKNERSSFQIAFYADKEEKISLSVEGEFADCVSAFSVEEVPVGTAAYSEGADDFYLRKTSGMYPDYLLPVNGELVSKSGKWQSIWFEINPNGKTGKSELKITLKTETDASCAGIMVDVIDAELPEAGVKHTCWYHSDGICNYYGIKAMSEEFWRINENFIRMAAEHGINTILTPLFTPPLDTKVGGERLTVQLVGVKKNGAGYRFDFKNLTRWVEMCDRCGIKYFEMSHLFTQWGAKHAPKIVALDRKGREKKIFGWSTRTSSRKYEKFLRQFGEALVNYIDKNGLRERCFFHVSDEPAKRHLAVYKRRVKLISEIFEGFPVYDALSEYAFYELGVVKNPIPAINEIEDFVGRVDELWTYYCCASDHDNVPNRFMSMPSIRNRVLGVLMYKYDIKGFLQWGYNFYNSQYSIRSIDPFKVTDAGGGFPSGDSFVVYPGCKGEPLASLRLKVLNDGFEDLAALKLLESKIGRKSTLALLEDGLVKPLSFTEYPHESEWLLELRNRINQKIKEN